jgi:hypothetical protein
VQRALALDRPPPCLLRARRKVLPHRLPPLHALASSHSHIPYIPPHPRPCSRAAGSLGVPGLAEELAEPLLFCELMVFGT